MKKYILFENKGLLEPRALYMIGASTKRDTEGKIGRFGSGFKYSLAKVLRAGLAVHIFAGETAIAVGTSSFTLREKSFEALTIDGKETSITTEMGPDWKMWQVVREFWCNAIDEGAADWRVIEDEQLLTGRDAHTRIFLEINPELQEVIDNWPMYFAHDREDIVRDLGSDGRIYRAMNGKTRLYRHGILVHESEKPALYHYDLPRVGINEERLITSEWEGGFYVAQVLSRHADHIIAANVLRNASRAKTYEGGISFDHQPLNRSWEEAFHTFKQVVLSDSAGHYLNEIQAASDNYALVEASLAKQLVNSFGVTVMGLTPNGSVREWAPVPDQAFSEKEKFLLKRVLTALQDEIGYSVRYPVTLADFTDPRVQGMADMDGKQILLSRRIFDRGLRTIALVIMEENEHLYCELADESRALQNHLFNMYLAALEEKAGYFL